MKTKKNKNASSAAPPPPFMKPQLCPDAILQWANSVGNISRSDLTEKVRAHLAALGCKFWYKSKSNDKLELRYESPPGKVHYSLRTACKACLEEDPLPLNFKDTALQPKVTLNVVPPAKPRRRSKRKAEELEEPIRGPKAKRGKILADLKRLRDDRKRCRDVKMTSSDDKNHDECSECCYGGDLVLCDGCPCAFHTGCAGLSEVGDGDWFCPACICGVCGCGILEDDAVAKCEQCRVRYHFECVKDSEEVKVNVDGKMFCNRKCESVSLGIGKILGKAIVVGPENLTWTLLKSSSTGDFDNLTKNYRQHKLAVELMHQCFEPSRDPETKSDVVDDVIFLRQKKFLGFYTVVLERNEEVISTATVRVYRELGEVPLVATKFKHRRLGMCRILMDELEKQLVKLGVEKLVLPSAKSALDAWTRLGFSKMTKDESLSLQKHRFWNFADTIMCHKQLKQQPACAESEGAGGAIYTVTLGQEVDASQEACTMDIDYDFMLEDDCKFLTWYTSGSKEIPAV